MTVVGNFTADKKMYDSVGIILQVCKTVIEIKI